MNTFAQEGKITSNLLWKFQGVLQGSFVLFRHKRSLARYERKVLPKLRIRGTHNSRTTSWEQEQKEKTYKLLAEGLHTQIIFTNPLSL